jgi:hypothetical protein
MHADPSAVQVPTVLDVEASGFGRKSYPIEIGFVLPDGHAYCTLIRPEPDWTHWDAQAQATHHIARAIVVQRGLPAVEVARSINVQLAGQTVYSDGWANDYSWLGALFDAVEMVPSFRLESLRALLTEVEASRWHTVKAQVAQERGAQRHRASADARLLQLTLRRLREASAPSPHETRLQDNRSIDCRQTNGASAVP